MPNQFAISDIHGNNKTFNQLLQKIGLNKQDKLFLLGDYIDRGPDSKGVINTILNLKDEGYDITCLMGNHEHYIPEMPTNKDLQDKWYHLWGGAQTLKSYQIDDVGQFPKNHLQFINSLKYYYEHDNFLMVHAGLDFSGDDPLQNIHQLMWARHWYVNVNYNWLGNRIIIHGHTTITKSQIITMRDNLNTNQYLNIDCGCYATDQAGKGYLCAFELSSRQLYFQKNVD